MGSCLSFSPSLHCRRFSGKLLNLSTFNMSNVSMDKVVEAVEEVKKEWGEEPTGVLKKAETEYKGHRSLLMRTRNLLSTMQHQDIIDRVILAVGFVLFFCAVLYVVSKRIGILNLQSKVAAALKASMAGQAEILNEVNRDGVNIP